MSDLSKNTEKLKLLLEDLYRKYSLSYLESDPIYFPHQYKDPLDIEIAGLVASALAYGKVDLFKPKIAYILDVMGKSPKEYIQGFKPAREHRFDSFVYRFNRGPDIIHLFSIIQRIIKTSGSVKTFFMKGYSTHDPDTENALSSFVHRILEMDCREAFPGGKLSDGFRHLFPAPGKGACKRLNMFLRWMIGQHRLRPLERDTSVKANHAHRHPCGQTVKISWSYKKKGSGLEDGSGSHRSPEGP